MCSSMLLVVQSTMVTASMVRGSAPRPTTISLVRVRSWADAGRVRPATAATRAARSGRREPTHGASPCARRLEPSGRRRVTGDPRALPTREHTRPISPQNDGARIVPHTRSFGSRVSRSQSPSRLTPSAVRASAAPGQGAQPPRHVQEVAALRQHAAPGGRGRLHAEAEEADGRLGHDELRELQAGHHDDGRRHVGQHVAEEQARATRAQRGGRLDEVALLDRQHLPAHDPRVHHPSRRGEAEDDVAQPQPHDGVDGQGEQDERKGELHVGQAHERGRRPALHEARHEPEAAPDHRGGQHRAHADEEREARPVEDARQEVAPELIRPQGMPRRSRGPQDLGEVGPERIGGRQPRRPQGGQQDGQREGHPEAGLEGH